MIEGGERQCRKYVFVCGLQRSGTSVLARNLGKLENCTGFRNTGVVEDEGQYLQDVYPTNNELGGTGWYGFNPRAHLTEASELLTPRNVTRMRESWHKYWDENKSICLEKTPSNLLMTRFLQAAFPQSYFIVVRRHPIAVSMANQRWKKSTASLHVGFEHWLRCYELFEGDKKHLKHVYELKYEDYIENPARYHQEIATFIGTRAMNEGMEEVSGAHNKRYFDRWMQLMTQSSFRKYYQYIAVKYESRFVSLGYSLIRPAGKNDDVLLPAVSASEWIGRLSCAGADFHAFLWRAGTRARGQTKRAIRKSLPPALKERLKGLLRTAQKHPDKANVA